MVEDDITVSQHWGRMRHEWEKQYIESDISTQMTRCWWGWQRWQLNHAKQINNHKEHSGIYIGTNSKDDIRNKLSQLLATGGFHLLQKAHLAYIISQKWKQPYSVVKGRYSCYPERQCLDIPVPYPFVCHCMLYIFSKALACFIICLTVKLYII